MNPEISERIIRKNQILGCVDPGWHYDGKLQKKNAIYRSLELIILSAEEWEKVAGVKGGSTGTWWSTGMNHTRSCKHPHRPLGSFWPPSLFLPAMGQPPGYPFLPKNEAARCSQLSAEALTPRVHESSSYPQLAQLVIDLNNQMQQKDREMQANEAK